MISTKNLFHIISWGLFILYEIIVSLVISGRTSSFPDYFVHYVLNIAFFYTNAYVLIRLSSKKIDLPKILFIIIAEIIFYIAINYEVNIILQILNIQLARPAHPLGLFLFSSLWRCLYFLGLSTAYAFAWHSVVSKREIINLKQQQIDDLHERNILEVNLLNSRNEYLKLQFNPHLMFNTLNFIYNTVRKVSREGGKSVLLLSEISRYTYLATKDNCLTFLSMEVEQIENLIELNKIRLNGELFLDLVINSEIERVEMLPLVLLTLTENMFKYGNFRDENRPALIEINIHNDILSFRTSNLKEKTALVFNTDRTGIKNTRARLDNFYKTNYKFTTEDTDETFNVFLEIKL